MHHCRTAASLPRSGPSREYKSASRAPIPVKYLATMRDDGGRKVRVFARTGEAAPLPRTQVVNLLSRQHVERLKPGKTFQVDLSVSVGGKQETFWLDIRRVGDRFVMSHCGMGARKRSSSVRDPRQILTLTLPQQQGAAGIEDLIEH
jgi:hypothetical protein